MVGSIAPSGFMLRFGLQPLLVYLLKLSWQYTLARSWRHARASMRIYQTMAEREPQPKLRAMLLQLAANEARHADRRAENLRNLPVLLPEDRDSLGERFWRWVLVRCSLKCAMAWMERVEHHDLALAVLVVRLANKAGGGKQICAARSEGHDGNVD